MAKTKDEAPNSEIEFLISELGAKDAILAKHQEKISKLETLVEKLVLESQLGSQGSELPAEIYKDVRPDQIYNSVIQGLVIGSIQTYGVALERSRMDAVAKRIVSFADTIFKEVLKSYTK
jgi:hypothetical protein